MKKTFTILSLIAIAGCNVNRTNTKPTDTLTVDTSSTGKYSMADSAKMMLDSSDFYMKKGITKELSQQATRAKVKPFMEKFQKIYSKLSPADTAIVYQYRIDALNKLIDLQVEQTKKESK